MLRVHVFGFRVSGLRKVLRRNWAGPILPGRNDLEMCGMSHLSPYQAVEMDLKAILGSFGPNAVGVGQRTDLSGIPRYAAA